MPTETQIKDGGPALPCSNEQFTHGNPQAGDAWSGMSLRDWFAGQALAGIIDLCRDDSLSPADSRPAHFAWRAYAVADAMLAARKAEAV